MTRNDRSWTTPILLALLGTVGVIAIVALTLFGDASPDTRERMRFELFTNVLQLGVIVVIGGGVALLYKWIEHGWETAREQAERRRRYIDRLGDAYRAVREARRRLRACGFRGASGPPNGELTPAQLTCLDEQMLRISQEQLRLEALLIESQHVPPTDDGTELSEELGVMARYLGRIVSEYERHRPEERISLDDLKRLREFTRGTGEDTGPIDPRAGTLQENFIKPHYRAVAMVTR